MKRVLPPTYLLVALAAMAALHFLSPGYQYLSFPFTLSGVAPLLLGVLLNVTAERQFKASNTTVKPFQQSSALVKAFPFSITRNPMYVGLSLLLLGIALLLGSVTALIPVLVFPYVIDRVFIRTEENMLAETFGAEWDDYRSKVRRWI